MNKGFLVSSSGNKAANTERGTNDDHTSESAVPSVMDVNLVKPVLQGSISKADEGVADELSTYTHQHANIPEGDGVRVSQKAGRLSFANVLKPERIPRKVNFRPLVNETHIENHDTLLPKAAMEGVLSRFDNTLVGFFIG